MAQFNETWVEHQRRRWMRPDAHRWMRQGHSGRYDRKHDFIQPQLFVDDPDLDWRAVTAIRRAQCEVAAARVELALKRLADVWRKANFDPNQPRVPVGKPGGGQWTSEGDLSAGPDGDVPLKDLPKIPKEKPLTRQLQHRIVKEVAKWIAERALRQLLGPVGTVLNVVEAGLWLHEYAPLIQSYLDEPKSLEELQRAVSDPQKGYDTHHIVEQTSAQEFGFSRWMIDAPDNLVRIPRLKHWEINGWYQTLNKDFGGLTPREYLRGKSWDERRRVGLDALIDHGVLKP